MVKVDKHRGYQLLATEHLDTVLGAFKSIDFLVATCHWLIDELNSELRNQLAGVQIEVIKIAYMGAYPGLAVHYDNPDTTPDVCPLVEAAIDRLLRERSVMELIAFLKTSQTDWNAVSERIMSEGK